VACYLSDTGTDQSSNLVFQGPCQQEEQRRQQPNRQDWVLWWRGADTE